MTPLASSSASSSFNLPTALLPSSSSSSSPSCSSITVLKLKQSTSISTTRNLFSREKINSCGIALKPNFLTLDSSSSSLSSISSSSSAAAAAAAVSVSAAVVTAEEEELGGAKIGSRVRVKVPLKVYHVPKVPEIDITGMEGVVKQYVGLWKGKRISANLPFKIEFITEVEGRGSIKFFAHLKEDEFEYVDQD